MEFLNLLIRGQTQLCFLCFNANNTMFNISSNLEIEEELFDATLSLSEMMKYLFPYFDITLSQACENCYNLILKMYIIIKRNSILKKIINIVIDKLNHGLNLKNNVENIYLKINFNKIMTENKQITYKPSVKPNSVENNKLNIKKKLEKTTFPIGDKQCPQCFKTLENNKLFKNHIRGHKRKREQKYYNCNHCTYRSLCKTSVDGHINKFHLKHRPHTCDICYKSFFHKKNLIVHKNIHSPKRNEICEICGLRFLHKKNLLEHLKLHDGVRPFECHICGKKFITSGRRLEHVKRIHSEKTECCLLCEKKFSLAKELRRHMKNVHASL